MANVVTMYNPKTSVIIQTVENYKSNWEKLGFIELPSNVRYIRAAC